MLTCSGDRKCEEKHVYVPVHDKTTRCRNSYVENCYDVCMCIPYGLYETRIIESLDLHVVCGGGVVPLSRST